MLTSFPFDFRLVSQQVCLLQYYPGASGYLFLKNGNEGNTTIFWYAIAGFEQYYIGLVPRYYRSFVGYAKVHYTFEESEL
jgi:hypothetical protein